jgi:hypothetical protein
MSREVTVTARALRTITHTERTVGRILAEMCLFGRFSRAAPWRSFAQRWTAPSLSGTRSPIATRWLKRRRATEDAT